MWARQDSINSFTTTKREARRGRDEWLCESQSSGTGAGFVATVLTRTCGRLSRCSGRILSRCCTILRRLDEFRADVAIASSSLAGISQYASHLFLRSHFIALLHRFASTDVVWKLHADHAVPPWRISSRVSWDCRSLVDLRPFLALPKRY